MSENESKQVRRATSALTWYSVYQSQVVGQPNTLWASEDKGKMSNGFVSDSVVRGTEESIPIGNYSKASDDCNQSKDIECRKYSKDADDIKDEDKPCSHKFQGHAAETSENGGSGCSSSSSSSSKTILLRPLSMDFRRTEMHQTTDVEPKLQRSWSTIPKWEDVYDEFKLPKRYQKPTNTKINTRLSRTYITGAGSDKCKNCGQRLYEMEKINANHNSYHRACFQCSRCQRLLSLSTFISIDGQLYCSSHLLDVVNKSKPNSETQNSTASEGKHPHILPEAQMINEEVTLTSIADIKSRFEIPSNDKIESEKKANNQEPQKIQRLTEDVSVRTINSFMTRDAQFQHSKPMMKHSLSLHDNVATVSGSSDTPAGWFNSSSSPFELKTEEISNKHFKEDDEIFDTPQHTNSLPFSRDSENDILAVADAFAKFKEIENAQMERIPHSEFKPVGKRPLFGNIKSSVKHRSPETKEIGYNLSSYFGKRNDKTEDKLPTASIPEPAMNNTMNPASKDMAKAEESKRAEVGHEVHETDVPPVGITKRLVTQWKLMDIPDGAPPVHRSGAPVVSTPTLGYSTTEMALNASSMMGNTAAHSLQLTNGFPPTEASSSCENNLELVRKHKETVPQDNKLLRKSGGQEMTAIDFTRNQLPKFKELEAMAQQFANPYPATKKDFRWGVKEVSPLHRPIVQANPPPSPPVRIALKTDDQPAKLTVHTPLADQTDGWKELKRDDCPAKPFVMYNPLAAQTHSWNGQKTDDHPAAILSAKPVANPVNDHTDAITLQCMKEALAQFKSMEDLTRPPPNPVLALSKQKAAIATHMKQYHDIIHISYAMQTVED